MIRTDQKEQIEIYFSPEQTVECILEEYYEDFEDFLTESIIDFILSLVRKELMKEVQDEDSERNFV